MVSVCGRLYTTLSEQRKTPSLPVNTAKGEVFYLDDCQSITSEANLERLNNHA